MKVDKLIELYRFDYATQNHSNKYKTQDEYVIARINNYITQLKKTITQLAKIKKELQK